MARFNLVPSPDGTEQQHGSEFDQCADPNNLNTAYASRSTATSGSFPNRPDGSNFHVVRPVLATPFEAPADDSSRAGPAKNSRH